MDEKLKKDFITYLIGKKAKKINTAKTYLRQVRLFEERTGIALDKVTHEDIVEFLAKMKLIHARNANTRRLMKTGLETFYAWYSPIVGISNPTIGLEKIKRYISHPKLIHPEELERMIYAIEQRNNDRSRAECALLAFLADTGIRMCEFEKIHLGNIRVINDKRNKLSHFEIMVPAIKGTYERVVPFSNLIDGGLAEYFSRYYLWLVIKKGQKPSMPLFYKLGSKHRGTIDKFEKQMNSGMVATIIRKAAHEIGIDRSLSPHQFRHFYGTYSILNGMDIFTLRDLMGHANITTTQQYVHIAEIIAGSSLKFSATKNIKAQQHIIGFSKVMRELAKKI